MPKNNFHQICRTINFQKKDFDFTQKIWNPNKIAALKTKLNNDNWVFISSPFFHTIDEFLEYELAMFMILKHEDPSEK